MALDYVGKCPHCGRVDAACAVESSPEALADWCRDVALEGMSIERMETEEIRKTLCLPHYRTCPRYRPRENQADLFAEPLDAQAALDNHDGA